MFPYTAAELDAGLSDAERDRLNRLSHVSMTSIA